MPYDVRSDMRPVARDAFFRVIGPLNVHPRTAAQSLRDPQIASEWEMLDGSRALVGISLSGRGESQYFLAQRYVQRGPHDR